jgi:hypothetical protein
MVWLAGPCTFEGPPRASIASSGPPQAESGVRRLISATPANWPSTETDMT